ncbi:MAG: hypothetical protein QXM27_03220 [Candidatus Pacearchaeota archaeon]
MREINESYIRARYGKLSKENIDRLITAMKRYGNNHWWESTDLATIAYYQLFEDVLLVDFSLFHEGLEKLLGRPVYTHELALNIEGLREEAKLAIKRYEKGIGTSDEYKEEAVRRSIKMLEDYCKRTGKKFLKINVHKPLDIDE